MPNYKDLKNKDIKKANNDFNGIILNILKETEKERKELFKDNRTVSDLTEAERTRAAKLYEFIFGMLANRPEVKLFKEVHPEAKDTDFIFVNNQSMTEIIQNDTEIHQAIKDGKVKPVMQNPNAMDDFIGAKALEIITKAENEQIGFSELEVNKEEDGLFAAGISLLGEVAEKVVEELGKKNDEINAGENAENEGEPEKKNEEIEIKEPEKENEEKENNEPKKDEESDIEEERIENIDNTSEHSGSKDEKEEGDLKELETQEALPTMEEIKKHIQFEEPNTELSITDRLIAEKGTFAISVYEEENNINKTLKNIQKGFGKQNAKNLSEDEKEKIADAKREWEEVINARILQLADMYRMKEITGYYLQVRAEQLNALKINPWSKVPNTPEVETDKVPESEEELNNLITDRLEGRIWKDHLKDLPTFIQWKLENDNTIKLEEFDKDEWELLYKNACRREMEKNPPALPEKVMMPHIESEEEGEARLTGELLTETSRVVVDAYMNDPSVERERIMLSSKGTKNIGTKFMIDDRKRRFKQMLDSDIPHLSESSNNTDEAKKGKTGKEAENQKDSPINKMLSMGAEILGLEIITLNDNLVPGRLYFYTFVRRLGKDPSFQKVMKSLIGEVQAEYEREKEKNPEVRVSDIPKAQRFLEMFEDKSLLSAVRMQMKIDRMGKNPKNAVKKNAPKTRDTGTETAETENGAIKHAKIQLNKPKNPEEGKDGPKL